MDNDDNYDVYQAAAARAAQMKEQEAQKKASEQEKTAGTSFLFTGTHRESIQAKYIAQVLFPILAEVIPESVRTTEKKRDLLIRMFGGPEAYVKRLDMIELYKALRDFKRQYLKDKMKFDPKEIEIIFQSDAKRRQFRDAVKDITGYSG